MKNLKIILGVFMLSLMTLMTSCFFHPPAPARHDNGKHKGEGQHQDNGKHKGNGGHHNNGNK